MELLTDKQKKQIWALHMTGNYYQREIAEIVKAPLHRVNLYIKERTKHPCYKCVFCFNKNNKYVCVKKNQEIDKSENCECFKQKS